MNSTVQLWTSRVLMSVFAAFLLIASAAPKLVAARVAVEPLAQLGWPTKYVVLLGGIELACVLLYLYPRTRMLGAVLTTALLGGAIATQMRVESPLFSHTLFGVYLGVVMWAAVWLRDPALRASFPFRAGR